MVPKPQSYYSSLDIIDECLLLQVFATRSKYKTETPTDKAKRFCLSDDEPEGFELVWVNDFEGIEKIHNISHIDYYTNGFIFYLIFLL